MLIPVAYVTKWVGQILVVRGGNAGDDGYLHWTTNTHTFVSSKHWTEDLVIAQARAVEHVARRAASLRAQADELDRFIGKIPVKESAS